jgi:hypothetical protein
MASTAQMCTIAHGAATPGKSGGLSCAGRAAGGSWRGKTCVRDVSFVHHGRRVRRSNGTPVPFVSWAPPGPPSQGARAATHLVNATTQGVTGTQAWAAGPRAERRVCVQFGADGARCNSRC